MTVAIVVPGDTALMVVPDAVATPVGENDHEGEEQPSALRLDETS